MLDAFIMEFKVCDERTEKSLEPAPALFLPRSIDAIFRSIHAHSHKYLEKGIIM